MCSADETSEQINQVKASFPDRPVFVTGFHCVGMSVTFISKETGNFDNVIFSHNHFPSDVQYQLCRFLFNHTKWSEQERLTIKKTKLFIGKGYSEMLQNCLEYESQVDLIDSRISGSLRGKDEVIGMFQSRKRRFQEKRSLTQLRNSQPFLSRRSLLTMMKKMVQMALKKVQKIYKAASQAKILKETLCLTKMKKDFIVAQHQRRML